MQTRLQPITPHVIAALGRTNVGILLDAGGAGSIRAYLIDSGGSARDAAQLLELTEDYCMGTFGRGMCLRAVLCTHSHADHCGGNAYLQQKTRCGVWATHGEAPGIEDQRLEPSLIWGGSAIPEMRGAFYEAQNSHVTRVLRGHEEIALGALRVRVIPLPGHYLEPAGFLVQDTDAGKSVFFLGDALFGRKNMGRHWIPYIYDIDDFKKSLETIAGTKSDLFLPSHGDLTASVDEVIELDLLAIMETEEAIVSILRQACGAEELLKKIADMNGISMVIGQCVLIGSTVRAYITSLYKAGRIFPLMRDNRLLWQAAQKQRGSAQSTEHGS